MLIIVHLKDTPVGLQLAYNDVSKGDGWVYMSKNAIYYKYGNTAMT